MYKRQAAPSPSRIARDRALRALFDRLDASGAGFVEMRDLEGLLAPLGLAGADAAGEDDGELTLAEFLVHMRVMTEHLGDADFGRLVFEAAPPTSEC